MSLDPIGDQIAAIHKEQQRLRAERGRLERLHGRPGVDVVVHYWRHHQKHEDAEEMTLREAWDYLAAGADYGNLSADGVSVNGVYFDYEQLRKMFQDEED